mgnify:CR=1 FL=1
MSEATETYLWVVTHPMLWIFLGLTALFFVVQWLVNPRPEAADQKRGFDTAGWMRRHYVAIVFALGGAAIVAAIYFYVAEVGIAVARLVDRLRTGANDLAPEEAKNLAYGIAVLLGAVVAAATIPFTLLRTWINERSTTAQEQGLITDRINKAVEGLGADKETNRIGRSVEILEIPPGFEPDDSVDVERLKNPPKRTEIQWQREPLPVQPTETQGKVGQWEVFTASEPNLEVRIGAIYALERISQDSARDHIQIMEILCAYIRQNAGREAVPLPEGDATPEDWKAWAQGGQEHPRQDVDVALKVIERRNEDRKQLERDEDYRLGFERAQLRKIILSLRDLTGADLQSAELQGADLVDAKLRGAILAGADLQGAILADANLQGAFLVGAKLQEAIFIGTNLKAATLLGSTLQGALFAGAEFNEDTSFSAANLRRAEIRDVDCTYTLQI